MSNDATAGLPVRERPDGRWDVHVADGEVVTVQTRAEADVLAMLPVESGKRMNGREPDLALVHEIVKVGRAYRYTSHAFRGLERLLTEVAAKRN